MGFKKHWQRLQRSLGRRWKEFRLPRGYERLGTKYGGWWVDTRLLAGTRAPLLIDCGLGEDISFPTAFLNRFGGQVLGVEPNPQSLAYVEQHCPAGMTVWRNAFWHRAETLTFHLPRPKKALPKGADGVSGSLVSTHEYVDGGDTFAVATVTLETLLASLGRSECDVLKMDVEGAEYDILDHLCATGQLRCARQLLIEFHHRVTHHGDSATAVAAEKIRTQGFVLIHVESRNYIFRRTGPR